MPHIVVQYSVDVADQINLPKMLRDLHQVLADEGIDKSRIKTQGIPLRYAVVGDNETRRNVMAHATLLLLEGRDTETKQRYGGAIFEAMKACIHEKMPNASVTLEVRDMVADTYFQA